jgi:hypothetical protein
MKNELLRASIVGPAVGVKPATLLSWFRRGWIPGYRAGRRPVMFDLAQVREAMALRAAKSQGGPNA